MDSCFIRIHSIDIHQIYVVVNKEGYNILGVYRRAAQLELGEILEVVYESVIYWPRWSRLTSSVVPSAYMLSIVSYTGIVLHISEIKPLPGRVNLRVPMAEESIQDRLAFAVARITHPVFAGSSDRHRTEDQRNFGFFRHNVDNMS